MLAIAVFAGLAGPAMASTSVRIYKYTGGDIAGYGRFNADPSGSVPGDAIIACDSLADGYAIWVHLRYWYSDGGFSERTTSTSGHASPYCTPWATGNIEEEQGVELTVCKISGGVKTSCETKTGKA